MNTEIMKKIENTAEAILNTDLEMKDLSETDKTMFRIAVCLMCTELNTTSLKNNGLISEKELSRFSKDINKLRKKYKDLFNNLLETDTSYIW